MNKIKQAACVLIENNLGEILLVTRRNSTKVGLPGGKVDEGEDVLTAAVREIYEETGIKLDPSTLMSVFVDVCKGEVDYETTCFIATYDGPLLEGQEDGIISKWGTFDDLIENSPFKEYNKKLFDALKYSSF